MKSRILFLVLSAPLFGAILEGTAAIVQGQMLTVTDVRFHAVVENIKKNESVVNPLEGAALKRATDELILIQMLYNESKGMGMNVKRSEAVTQYNQHFKKRPQEWRKILERFGRSEQDAIDLISKSLQAERFMRQKMETLTPVITDLEVQKYYEQNQSRLKGSLENLKPSIILLLKKEQREKGLEEWIRYQKEKYQVVNLLVD